VSTSSGPAMCSRGVELSASRRWAVALPRFTISVPFQRSPGRNQRRTDAQFQDCWPRPRGRRIRNLRPCPSSTNRSVGNPPAAPRYAPLQVLPASGFSTLRLETLSGRGRAGQFCATCVQPFRRVRNRSGLFSSIAERPARSKRVLSRSRRYAQSESARHQAQRVGTSPHNRNSSIAHPTASPSPCIRRAVRTLLSNNNISPSNDSISTDQGNAP